MQRNQFDEVIGVVADVTGEVSTEAALIIEQEQMLDFNPAVCQERHF